MASFASGQYYSSDLLSFRVMSADGTLLGRVRDVEVELEKQVPVITRVVFRKYWSRQSLVAQWMDVEEVSSSDLMLKIGVTPLSFTTPEEVDGHRVFLRDVLLDKQIVDVHGAKVVRVNDLLFSRMDGRLGLVLVDVGLRGLLRRLGFEGPVDRFFQWFFDYRLRDKYINWQYVQPLAYPDRLKLQIPQSKLAELHPADLADIMEDLDVHERAAVVESLEDEVVAEAMEEMDPKVQISIMRSLGPEKAADILEEMSPDEAADLIADLPTETVHNIFEEMDRDYQAKVKGLLAHDEDTAGGLMTNQFLAFAGDQTIVDALAHIRRHADEVDVIYYIYVLGKDSQLLGVINLRELLSNEIFTPLERIMTDRVITAHLSDDAETLADMFAKYGFRAIPILDEKNSMVGVIRFKTILEILAPHLGR